MPDPTPTHAPNPEPGPQYAVLCLHAGDLDPVAIEQNWAELFPDLAPLKLSASVEGEDGPEVWCFHTASKSLTLAFSQKPVADEDFPKVIKGSWMIQDDSVTGEHDGFALVDPSGSGGPLEQAILATRFLAAAARCSSAAGVYWGNGGQFHKPDVFTDLATKLLGNGSLPAILWIGLRHTAPGPDGPWTLTTVGMRPFGHLEFEVIDSKRSLGDLRMGVLDLASYVLLNGPVLQHGNTFGSSAAERIRVEHTTSQFREGEPVIRLHM